MNRSIRLRFLSIALVLCCAGVAPFADAASTVTLTPGPNAQEAVQEALILAEPGQVIELGAGVFEFTRGLSLDVDNVTLRGQGMDKTILSFKNQTAGSEGLSVTSDGVTLQDFAVEDAIGDAIKVNGVNQISFIRVRAEWTGGPKPTNGAYGLYPVACENVLIDGCVAIGASDAGLYIGQSRNVVVRNSVAKYNVAGIEIENCYNADVYNNLATHNTGGILVFDLPNLPQQGGHTVRVFNNRIVDNDTQNFAPPGNIVGNVPTGTGMLIMANRNVEIFGNILSGNGTANLMISSYKGSAGEKVDPNYYKYPEGIHVHHNEFGTGGEKPDGILGKMAAAAAGSATLPDIVWDGVVNGEKIVDGKMPEGSGIYIHDNGDADFVNIDYANWIKDATSSHPSRDLAAHAGSMPALSEVKLPQDS
ncbi:MAG: right-handed parallel beta-helix repeat-containing protein [Candidatus Hydrogenedentes bacterium]|nr:right-handed parallel beta-helix repeat-containing protein [Candidatus Hydrogenedentota bacterium]